MRPVPLRHVEQEGDEYSEAATPERVECLRTTATMVAHEVDLAIVGVLVVPSLDRDR